MRDLQDSLGYRFHDPALLRLALTHPSTLESDNNQRLEFLGDAVLELYVSDLLYRKYPELREGRLTARRAALVCERTLSVLAGELAIGAHLRIGPGEAAMGGREKPSLLSDAFEAVLAAVYLDGGPDEARRLVGRLFADDERLARLKGQVDKGARQAFTQAIGLGLPEYAVGSQQGPDNDRTFTVETRIQGRLMATASGRTKRAAEQEAARIALAACGERA